MDLATVLKYVHYAISVGKLKIYYISENYDQYKNTENHVLSIFIAPVYF